MYLQVIEETFIKNVNHVVFVACYVVLVVYFCRIVGDIYFNFTP